jgi:P-type Cu+ transporter
MILISTIHDCYHISQFASQINLPHLLMETISTISTTCYHCGETCDDSIHIQEKLFCCEGCKQVFLLLDENNLCNYYNLENTPGITAKGKFTSNRFAYLDDAATINKIIQFGSETQVNVTFHLPQMHCSSCVYLLENLHRINPSIIKSQTNFQRKEIFIVFNPSQISLRKVVELLAFVGYEPQISLEEVSEKKVSKTNRKAIFKIGLAGFCFGNIMMLSFPEYFSGGVIEEYGLRQTFSYLIFGLSIPVLFWCASDFFISAFKSIRQGYLNIDAPIALATLITFSRSYYEILSGSGAGFLDSGTGIVFFMLIGRWFQNKTYDSISFDRDYKSYFPLGVSVLKNDEEKNIPVTQLQKGNRIIIRNEEMIPADAILINGLANIDYSFISGENLPVSKHSGEIIYAGGKQIGTAIELEIIKEVSQSYITQLWNNQIFKQQKNQEQSFIHPWSRYFTLALFSVACGSVVYWWAVNPANIFHALTSVLIVACPCSLLLSATFTHGNMMRLFGKNKLYLKNNSVIEALAKVNTIVFDKTGTITHQHITQLEFVGKKISEEQNNIIQKVCSQSTHPLSKIMASKLFTETKLKSNITQFEEIKGKGILCVINQQTVKIGSANYIFETNVQPINTATEVHVMIDNLYLGYFKIENNYREGATTTIENLLQYGYELHVLSGDNDGEKQNLEKLFHQKATLKFYQSPQEKLAYINQLQTEKNRNVLMLGDGLNDAGALMQSNVGIAVSDNTTLFTPACDAILDGNYFNRLNSFMRFAKSGKQIVTASFILSILYNIIGLSFASSANLSPMIAAILMPISSISIVLFVSFASSVSAKLKGL